MKSTFSNLTTCKLLCAFVIVFQESALANLNKSCSVSGIAAGNKEKARVWVREQAQKFVALYFDKDESSGTHPALNVLSRLTQAIERLQSQPWQGDVALAELKDIVMTSDISPFEVNHSGLIGALLHYLTFDSSAEPQQPQLQLQPPLQPQVVMQSTSQNNNNNIEVDNGDDSLERKPHPPRDLKLRVFLNVFAGCPVSFFFSKLITKIKTFFTERGRVAGSARSGLRLGGRFVGAGGQIGRLHRSTRAIPSQSSRPAERNERRTNWRHERPQILQHPPTQMQLATPPLVQHPQAVEGWHR